MTDTARQLVIDELDRAMHGDAWHGDPVATILQGVPADRARAKPIESAHSIWELVRHMTAWTEEVTRRLAGHPAGEPALGDWPAPSGDDDAWRRDVGQLFEAHRRLVAAIAGLEPGSLAEATVDPRNRALGTGVAREIMLHGLAQHHAYHAGQIALLKKAATSSDARHSALGPDLSQKPGPRAECLTEPAHDSAGPPISYPPARRTETVTLNSPLLSTR